jgi:hypothetical protein
MCTAGLSRHAWLPAHPHQPASRFHHEFRRRLEHEILTVTRLGLPKELRRSLACTNIIENVMGTVRRVCRSVKRWRSASMAMRWTAAAMREAAKRLPTIDYEGSQAASSAACSSGRSPQQTLTRRACSPSHRRLTSTSAATAFQCSTRSETSPKKNVTKLWNQHPVPIGSRRATPPLLSFYIGRDNSNGL